MGHFRVGVHRGRLFLGLLTLAIVTGLGQSATGAGKDTVSVVTVVTDSSPGGPGKRKAPSVREVAAVGRKDPCPASAVASPEGQMIDAGENGIGMYQPYQCNPATGWQLIFVCYQRCPAGTQPGFTPPTPPSLEELYIAVHRAIPAPDPLFAPPVEQGAGIAAIVGTRLYVNLTPASFEEKDGDYTWGGGYWYATVLLVPDSYSFTDGSSTSAVCTDNNASARTQTGRAVLDTQNCSIVINTKPADTTLDVTITSYWHAVITTNIPGVPQTTPLQSDTTYQVPTNEIQSIITN
jgi:hypothetical protein